MSLEERIATADGKRRHVRALFATIADRYDFITVVLSYGQDRRWKRALVAMARPAKGERALDLATGTGDIALALNGGCGRVVGLDVTSRMIQLARQKARGSPGATFLVGDMMALPFGPASFDIVTTGYGLRNVPDLAGAIDEIFRVLKPGGRALSLDFNRPANALVRALYLRYLSAVGGMLGWILHRDADTYRYIPASIRSYPGGAGVARLMERCGFGHVTHRPLLGGLMSLHHAVKP
jgi:demethylmenaquinone methyltransferase/2-methoxy-6-polyprenyl-1,4-benzoquinol methylase